MKLIRSGGVNGTLKKDDGNYNRFGFGKYFMLQIKPELDEFMKQGGSIALCVAAKADKHHYDQQLSEMGFNIDDFTILGREDDAEWDRYAAVLLLGGETKALYAWLAKTKFSRDALRNCRLLAGDSAGAYVLAGKTLMDYTPGGESFEVKDGFLPDLNQLIAAHANNPYYHQAGLTKALREWCQARGVAYIELQEGEVNIWEI